MTYSCPDFVDSIIDALQAKIPTEHADDPARQAEICLAEIQRLQRFEKDTRYAIAVLQDAPREEWILAQRQFIARLDVIADLSIDHIAPARKLGPIAIALEGGLVQSIVTDDDRLRGVDVLVVDYDTEGADEAELLDVAQKEYDQKRKKWVTCDHTQAVVRGDVIGSAHGIDLAELWTEANQPEAEAG